MKSLFLTAVYFAILLLGLQFSYVFVLGYVWVDIFVPQLLAYSILPSIPVSMIMALCVGISLFFLEKDEFVRVRAITVLVAIFAIWMTVTLLWAEVPDAAQKKWGWAVKSVVFSCFIPFFIRSRVHVEAFLWTLVISGCATCLTFGAKVLLTGGGYGKSLGLSPAKHGYGEGSTLAMFSISLIPICLYLYKHQTLVAHHKLVKWVLTLFIAMAFLTSLGTYARTGLVSIGMLGVLLLMQGQHRMRNFTLVGLALAVVLMISSDQWMTRMSTIGDGTESSAMGRVAVWRWTLEYIATHPWGGSFESYQINQMSMLLADGSLLMVDSKAFHSIYFEVLGETGIPGLVLFLTLIYLTYKNFGADSARASNPDMLWRVDVGTRLQQALMVFLVGGAFIGIAFQSYFYYLAALSVALINLDARMKAHA